MNAAACLYGGLTTVLAVAVGPLFVFHKRGRVRLGERFGGWSLDVPEVVWFHGASLGEMNGLLPLMRRWKMQFPEIPILATATSTTGLERASTVADYIRLVPFDSGPFIRRAIGAVKVRAFVFGETEIWPGLLGELEERGVPLLMVNARIGEASLRRYRRWGSLFRPMFSALRCVCATSETDRARLVELGVLDERCITLGNAKYDLEGSAPSEQERGELRARVALRDVPVIVLGSLRPGEEEWWFPVLHEFRDASLSVVVAPRHPEKFAWFGEMLEKAGLSFRRWSAPKSSPPEKGLDILLLDALGELRRVYAVADLAFVGGSLVDWGGHNPLEPALLGVPVATGPHMSSVSDMIAAFDEVGCRVVLDDRSSVERLVRRVLERDQELVEMGARSCSVAHRFTGAADAVFARILAGLDSREASVDA